MKNNKRSGISLIVLIITIIVIIILAGTIILSLSNNNPINTANEAIFKSDIASYNSELSLWIASKYGENTGNYDPLLLNATENTSTYNGGAITGVDNIKGIITSMKEAHKSKFKIVSGKLVYIGTDEVEASWAIESEIIVNLDVTPPTVIYATNGGTSETASTIVTVNDSGSGVNTSTLQYVWDTQDTTTPISGWAPFTNGETLTKTGVTGTYYLWIKGSDNAANNVVTKSNVFLLNIEVNQLFNYTGSYQTWTAPVTGNYMLEVWGSASPVGYSATDVSYGGYAYGEKTFTAGEIVYIYVGGITGYNGGGTGFVRGGGATDMRTIGGNWDDSNGLLSRLIVAGGAGGGFSYHGSKGGAGGGLIGLDSTGTGSGATGGTQTNGGIGGASGTFGKGGNGIINGNISAGGGGGWYGGGSGYIPGYNIGGGAGGSSYIGGVQNSGTTAGINTLDGKAAITLIL